MSDQGRSSDQRHKFEVLKGLYLRVTALDNEPGIPGWALTGRAIRRRSGKKREESQRIIPRAQTPDILPGRPKTVPDAAVLVKVLQDTQKHRS